MRHHGDLGAEMPLLVAVRERSAGWTMMALQPEECPTHTKVPHHMR